jgi:predicted RNase H-like nuclease (RuvC/YqgF family)
MQHVQQMLGQLRGAVEHLENRAQNSEELGRAIDQAHRKIEELGRHLENRSQDLERQLQHTLEDLERSTSQHFEEFERNAGQ